MSEEVSLEQQIEFLKTIVKELASSITELAENDKEFVRLAQGKNLTPPLNPIDRRDRLNAIYQKAIKAKDRIVQYQS